MKTVQIFYFFLDLIVQIISRRFLNPLRVILNTIITETKKRIKAFLIATYYREH